MKWQPIETAPKDGRLILCWDCWCAQPVVLSWKYGQWNVGYGAEYDPTPTEWMDLPEGP